MKPAPFEYVCPDTLDEALAALKQGGHEAKLLAGGQSLIPAMNFRVLQPALLIDLQRIPGLDEIQRSPGGLRLGAMVRQRSLERDAEVAASAPLIHETMPLVAHPQIRNRGTLGGSLAHADPSAELPAVVLALAGRMRAISTRGERWIQASEFFQGMFATALQPDEILVEIEIPSAPARTGWAFLEVARRRGDYALAGLAVTLTLDEKGVCRRARLVFLNAGDAPRSADEASRVLEGQRGTPELFDDAARRAAAEIDPPGNLHATPEFQRHLAGVLTRRALRIAHDRALGSAPK